MKIRALGDTVLMTAPLRELIRAYPNAEVHLVVATPWVPLFDRFPGVTKVWPYERRKDRASRAKAAVRMGIRLRAEKFDCVVNFHASPTSAMVSFATGAKTRSIHFHGHNDKNRYSTVEIPGKGLLKPIIERDMDAVRALGIEVPEGLYPQLAAQESEISWAREWLASIGAPDPLLGIGLGASRPTKSWPTDRFALLAIQWARELQGGVVAVAGASEKDLVHEFLKAVEDRLTSEVKDAAERVAVRARISATTDLTLRRLCGLLSRVTVFVGNDSGPRHLAVALGTSTVTLFGPEHPFEWHPYRPDRHPFHFIENLACRRDAMAGMPPWCGLDLCLIEEHQCMRKIGVEEVMAQCRRLVGEAR